MDFKERHAGRLLRVLIVASKGLRSKTAEFAGLSEKSKKDVKKQAERPEFQG